MAWNVEQAADGRTIWRGSDSFYNMDKFHHDTANTGAMGCLVSIFIGMAVIALMMTSTCTSQFQGKETDNSSMLVLVGFVALCGIAWAIYFASVDEWKTRSWELSGDAGGLTFQGHIGWKIPIDDVASVEATRTIDWQKVRDYAGEAREIPDVEWQTFLVLHDQTRRVIYYANAGREDCGALAASIRGWVNQSRSTPAPSGASSPRAGFDL